jgi:DNA replication licensing factor MCM2
MVYFTCLSCGVSLGPFKQNNSSEVSPGSCPCCHQRGPFKVDEEQTLYGNYQKLAIQEAPGAVPPGRVPRHKGVVLLADLIDVARPGEEVEVTGVYVHSYETGISGTSQPNITNKGISENHRSRRISNFLNHN